MNINFVSETFYFSLLLKEKMKKFMIEAIDYVYIAVFSPLLLSSHSLFLSFFLQVYIFYY